MGAEDPLFILYTSGSTGKPKGVLHTTGGYLAWASHTHELIFDYRPGEVFWCTADVGWVTGHSYIVYGPLANGATTVIFEGVPTYPDASRFWQVIDKHSVEIFYTAPTAIRALMREGDGPVKCTSRASLRLLGTVGEPINPEAWLWYYRVVGEGRCPVVDTWWQTETGATLIAPLPGATPLKPGSATKPLPGIKLELVDAEGKVLEGRGQRQSLHHRQLARADAHGLRRPRALLQHLLLGLSRQVLHGRRLPPRRGRLLLDHRSGGRRHQRLGPPHRHRRIWKARWSATAGRRGRGGRLPARHQGPGHLGLCHPDIDHEPTEALRAELVSWVRTEIGPFAAPDVIQWAPGPAQDPLGQDHAPHLAQGGRERSRQPRRHIDAGRPGVVDDLVRNRSG